MEARIGELLQHKVGHVGTIDAQAHPAEARRAECGTCR